MRNMRAGMGGNQLDYFGSQTQLWMYEYEAVPMT